MQSSSALEEEGGGKVQDMPGPQEIGIFEKK